MKFLLYGAYGYTGELTAELAEEFGLTPTLAGRNAEKLAALHQKIPYDYTCFNLSDADKIVQEIEGFDLVLHTAGPFAYTAKPMIEACLKAKTHYLDITGEIEVFELAKSYDERAKEAGILVLSGAGFDVVPTDCTAKLLHESLPDATHLELAFAGLGGQLSHGTAQTMLLNLGESGAIREDGKIKRVPLGHKQKLIDFGVKKRVTMTIPWGDVSTAFWTTQIPNIEVYTAVPPSVASLQSWQWLYNPILSLSPVKKLLQAWVGNKITGPTPEEREKALSLVWGKVRNAAGETREARLKGLEGYTLTAKMSLLIAKKVLSGNFKTGYHTPAGLFGSGLINELDGCQLELV
ncbi:MAG: saccharopine dehydrogenase NADP-binding domain-containing protein [Bacteroidota bacterium]